MDKVVTVSKKIENIYPLTYLQEGMLFHHLLNKESTNYVFQNVYSIDESIGSENIKYALALISKCFPALRTMIYYDKIDKAQQIVLKERNIEYDVIDLNDYSVDKAKEEFKRIIADDVKRGFDLQKDSLLRVTFVKLPNNKNKLIWTIHHIIIDGWGLNLVIEKFVGFCRALQCGMSYDFLLYKLNDYNERNKYSDYIKWLNKQDQINAKQYWRDLLDGYDNDCEIKALTKPEENEEQMNRVGIRLGKDETERLKKIASTNESTMNAVAETAVGILLQTYNRVNDVVFGKVV